MIAVSEELLPANTDGDYEYIYENTERVLEVIEDIIIEDGENIETEEFSGDISELINNDPMFKELLEETI